MSSDLLDRRSLLALLAGTSAGLCTGVSAAQDSLVDDDRSLEVGRSPGEGNIQLQTIGALGVGHIQSTLGLIGVIADSVSKEIYSAKQIEDLMNGTVNGLDAPKKMLRRLQDSNVSGDDAEFLDRMISVLNALQREARALTIYAKSRKNDDAAKYERERRLVLKKLSELTQQEELLQSDPVPRNVPAPRSGKVN